MTAENPVISVIVPVYMVEAYIRQCLDSLAAQTYQDIEFILVDDGSPDGCPAICDAYAAADPRFRVIHKANGGLSDARNAGIEQARGQWLGFVDSDDWVAPDFYQYLLEGALSTNADVVVSEYYNVWDKTAKATNRASIRTFEGDSSLQALLMLRIGNYAWNKLYRRTLWEDGVRYPAGKNFEDVRTTYRLLQRANKVVALTEAKYFYRRHEQSITGSKSVFNTSECVEARVERFLVLDDLLKSWPDVRRFLLKEIWGYTVEMRDAALAAQLQDFATGEEPRARVCSFLRDHAQEFFALNGWGRAGRKSFALIASGQLAAWQRSVKIDNLIQKKGAVQTRLRKLRSKALTKLRGGRNQEGMAFDWYVEKGLALPLETNLVFVESRGGGDLAGNMYAICQELCARGMRVALGIDPKERSKVETILATGSFPGLTTVTKRSKEYYRALAQAAYLFNDMTYPETVIKRPEQVFVNTWHGTPLKMLELDVVDQRTKSGGAARGYMQCDYIAVPSKYMADRVLESANIDQIFTGKILYSGYPRNEVFFDKERRAQVRERLGLKDKEVFVYMPTWRGSFDSHVNVGDEYSAQSVADFFDRTLASNQVMYMKLHNFAAESLSYDTLTRVRPFPDDMDAYEVLNAADCLITDYSSVFFDYANTGGKIVLFAHDRAKYEAERGMYLDLDSLPFPITYNYEQLSAQLNLRKDYDDKEFLKTYCTYDGPNATQRLLDQVIDGHQSCPTSQVTPNGKRNILIFDARFNLRNEFSDDIEEYLGSLDTEEANYYYGYRQWLLPTTPGYLRRLPKGIRIYSFPMANGLTSRERKASGSNPDAALPQPVVKREIARIFYGNPFDEIRLFQPNRYESHTAFLKGLPQTREV